MNPPGRPAARSEPFFEDPRGGPSWPRPYTNGPLARTSNPEASLEPHADDQLRRLFTCRHPSLSAEAQIALTLRLLMGLSTDEVARAFLIEPQTLAQRIVRAKRKIRAAAIPYRVPELEDVPERLAPALAACDLVYEARRSTLEEIGRDGDRRAPAHRAILIAALHRKLAGSSLSNIASALEVTEMTARRYIRTRDQRMASQDGSYPEIAEDAARVAIQDSRGLLRPA